VVKKIHDTINSNKTPGTVPKAHGYVVDTLGFGRYHEGIEGKMSEGAIGHS
jgi:hypothetical protein